MSTLRRRGLQLDDPLGAAQPAERPTDRGEPAAPPAPANPPDGAGAAVSQDGRRGEAKGNRQAETVEPRRSPARGLKPPRDAVWRTWTGITGVGSFRLPHELLVELGDSARNLQLPIGLIVTAAITQLLDQPPEQIAALVDRADDARIHGRREARRQRPGPTQG